MQRDRRHIMNSRIVLVLTTVLLLAAAAGAQPVCIPRADGVPPRNEPPNWWDSSVAPPAFNTELDAADWRGAFALGYPVAASTTEDMQFRALHRSVAGKEYLYLSWNGKTVPDLSIGLNKLYVGFNRGSDSVAIRIDPNVTSTTPASTAYNPVIRVSTGGSFTPYGGSIPAWLSGTARIWIGPTPTNHWAVQMRVPLSTLADTTNLTDGVPYTSGSNFRMWFEFRAGTPVTASTPFGYAVYKYPRTTVADVDPFTDALPVPTTWGDFRLNSVASPPDAGCSMEGVSLRSDKIGTTNVPPHNIRLQGPNTFFAKPFNHSTTTSAVGVQARFRIANWGVAAGWEDVPNPMTNVWLELPPGRVPAGGTTIGPNSEGNITNVYDISTATATCDRCRFVSYNSNHAAECASCTDRGSRLDHQCLLVELTGPGVTFLNDSVYRNMNFVDASSFSELAEVNLAGLPETAPGSLARDVYFYVQKFNMPPVREQPLPNNQDPIPTPEAAFRGGPDDRPQYQRNPAYDVTRPRDARRKELIAMLRNDQSVSFETLAANVPTVIVHAYYDTGVRNTTSGAPQAVLKKLNSFGYFVMHDGNPDAWRSELHGAVLIAPNWYHLGVPASGIARIRTVIESLGGPEPGPSASSSRYRFFFDLGPNSPNSGFGSFVDGRWSANVGIEKILRPNWSIEAIAGHHYFDGEIRDFEERFHFCLNIEQFSLNMKRYFQLGSGRLHWFMNAGGGAYYVDPPEDWNWGVNAGAGVLYNINSRWGIKGTYTYHRVNFSPDDLGWSTLQAGLRISF